MFSSSSSDKKIDRLEKFIEQFATKVDETFEAQTKSREVLGQWVSELSSAVQELSKERIALQEEMQDLQKRLTEAFDIQEILLDKIEALENAKD